jgi:hypothetical protein
MLFQTSLIFKSSLLDTMLFKLSLALSPLHLGVVGIDPERGAVVAGIASTPEAPNGEGLEHSFAGLE